MTKSFVTKFIVEFLEQIDEDVSSLDDELKKLIAGAVAHGAGRALDVVLNRYEHPNGEEESVSMTDILEEASEILNILFEEEDDEDEDDNDKKFLEEDTKVNFQEEEISLLDAQQAISDQCDSTNEKQSINWIALDKLIKGKKAN